MKKYDIIFEALQFQVDSGELTVEDAQTVADIAFERYGSDDRDYELEESYDDEMTVDEYLESLEYELFDESTRLSREIANKVNTAEKELNSSEKKIKDLEKLIAEENDPKIRSVLKKKIELLKNKGNASKSIIKKNTYFDSLNEGRRAASEKDENSSSLHSSAGRSFKKNLVHEYNLQKPAKEKEPGKYKKIQDALR